MKPDTTPFTVYSFAAGVAGQVGCFLSLIIGGGVLLGLLLDQLLGTKPVFLFVFLLGSIPLNLWAVFKYIQYKTKTLQTSSSPKKEGVIRDDQLES